MSVIKLVKDHETVVSKNDFGFLVREFIHIATKPNNHFDEEWLDKSVRAWWPLLDDYYLRQVQCDIEVAILLDEPPRNRDPLSHKEMWKKIIADLRPPKSPYTIEYHCDRCKTSNVKLWRGVHGCAAKDGSKLLCATCLVPGAIVDGEGLYQGSHGSKTDQVNSWLPAIPTGDTYWGYSSVPSQDVEWWKNLPTYPKQ